MAGIIVLVALCVVMTLASFLAGALPLSMTLSQSQLRLISSIGVGILVGTSLIVIIPEGIEAATTPTASSYHHHRPRSLVQGAPWTVAVERRLDNELGPATGVARRRDCSLRSTLLAAQGPRLAPESLHKRKDTAPLDMPADAAPATAQAPAHQKTEKAGQSRAEIPALEVGLSMILGFALMFLIDRLPRHATETFQSSPQTTHMSLDSLGVDSAPTDDEEDGFLGSLALTPRRARSLATTVGLVIHAAADGFAMGTSSASPNLRLGLIIFIAIMIHKAPAAFGLTSVLLRQGLSKRAARGHLIVFSLAAPVGALSTWLLVSLLGADQVEDERGQWWTGMLLLFSGGTFLYVAMHAMQEDAQGHDHGPTNGYVDGASSNQRKLKCPRIQDTMATVAGMFLPLLTQLGHHH